MPDLSVSLAVGPDAPRTARAAVRDVDCPTEELRDDVILLTSELVARALRQRPTLPQAAVKLRVWMPEHVVRVEVSGPPDVLPPFGSDEGPEYEVALLETLTDRWSLTVSDLRTRAWFEIDR